MVLDRLADVLTFEQVGDDRFVIDFAAKLPNPAERGPADSRFARAGNAIFRFIPGSYLLAMCLVVGACTVDDDFVPLSAHSVIPHAGDGSQPLEVSVERDSGSRRFARRRVRFAHGDEVFFFSDLCFHLPDSADGWQQPPIEMPAPEGLESSPRFGMWPVTEVRHPAGPDSHMLDDVLFPSWVRFPAGVPKSPTWSAAAQAWASDYPVAQSMLLQSGRTSEEASARTLEHSMWFHRPVDPSGWMLLNMTPTSLADMRYVATGTLHDRSGVLASTIVQSGVFLPNPTF